jgi:hypothetical protein
MLLLGLLLRVTWSIYAAADGDMECGGFTHLVSVLAAPGATARPGMPHLPTVQ